MRGARMTGAQTHLRRQSVRVVALRARLVRNHFPCRWSWIVLGLCLCRDSDFIWISISSLPVPCFLPRIRCLLLTRFCMLNHRCFCNLGARYLTNRVMGTGISVQSIAKEPPRSGPDIAVCAGCSLYELQMRERPDDRHCRYEGTASERTRSWPELDRLGRTRKRVPTVAQQ